MRFGPNLFRVSHKHEDALRGVSKILDVEPSVFLGWILDDEIKNLEDVQSGMLSEWAIGGLLKFETKAEERRVKARFLAWEKEKRGSNFDHARDARERRKLVKRLAAGAVKGKAGAA